MRVGILPMSVKEFRDSYPSSIVYKFKDDNLTFSIQSLKFFLLFQEKDCAWHRKHRTGLHHILYNVIQSKHCKNFHILFQVFLLESCLLHPSPLLHINCETFVPVLSINVWNVSVFSLGVIMYFFSL